MKLKLDIWTLNCDFTFAAAFMINVKASCFVSLWKDMLLILTILHEQKKTVLETFFYKKVKCVLVKTPRFFILILETKLIPSRRNLWLIGV